MSYVTAMLKGALLLPVCLSLGCASQTPHREGGALDIYPVTHSLSLQVATDSLAQSDAVLESYLRDYKQQLLTQEIFLYWQSEKALEFERAVKLRLLAMGVVPENVHSSELPASAQNHFNFRIKVVEHHVAQSTCGHTKVEGYLNVEGGCYTEGARWQSMVSPAKMLGGSVESYREE